jgi:uncharacterized phage protein (TIGR02220 family)
MAALPYMQFYVADYLADTMHLSTEEHGAYLLLIMNYWRRGKPLDGRNGRLASVVRMSNERWDSVEHTLREFFVVDEDGQWVHPRIEDELEKAQSRIDAAARAGKASAKARGNKRSTPVQRESNGRSTPVDDALQRKGNHSYPEPSSDSKKELLRNSCPASPDAASVLGHLNAATGSNFRQSKSALENINARLRDGHTVSDLCAVVDFKAREWAGTDMAQYLRPKTLFAPEKFPGYLIAARSPPARFSDTTRQNITALREWANGND